MSIIRERKMVKCPKCDWSWLTSGRRKYVACPNCFCNFIPEDEKDLIQEKKAQVSNGK